MLYVLKTAPVMVEGQSTGGRTWRGVLTASSLLWEALVLQYAGPQYLLQLSCQRFILVQRWLLQRAPHMR